ncbi:MAG TPA: AtpZ/AtpI family protein [Longimicrobiales bacterium]|nr:AtpZ/AtpI family protein [Longimicrobiales bacterium]
MSTRVEQPGRDRRSSTGSSVSEYLGHGLTWAASTLLFLWLGTKADGWLGTEPWLALAGAFVGAGAGFYHMYRHLVVAPRERPGGGKRGEGPSA